MGTSNIEASVGGMHTDNDYINQPDNTVRYVENGQTTKSSLEYASEYGFENLTRLGVESPSSVLDNILIGSIVVDDNNIVLFSTKNPYKVEGLDSKSEIGLMSKNGSYKVILRDDLLNFSIDHLIEGVVRRNYNNERVIYWTDWYNSIRTLNIDNPQVSINNLSKELEDSASIVKLNLFLTSLPVKVDLISVNDFGGSCESGVYYFAAAYEDLDGNMTDFVTISNPISVIDNKRSAIVGYPPTNYNGCEAGTKTSKSISLQLNNIDISYPFLRIAAIPKIGGVISTVKLLPKIGIDELTTSVSYTFTNLESFDELALADVIIPKTKYETAKTIMQVNDNLYLGNLTSKQDIGMQKYANLVVVDYVTQELNVNEPNISHFNEYYIYNNKGFMQDEVYSLYLSYILNDGSESKLYHIPGRSSQVIDASWNSSNFLERIGLQTILDMGIADPGITESMEENKLIDLSNPLDPLSSTVKWFHIYDTSNNPNATDLHGVSGLTSNMGYYENRDEFYPMDSEWDSSDISGAFESDLRGLNIRHHKIPSINREFTGSSNEDFKVVGLKLKNVIIPADKRDKIKYIKVYYAKRTIESATVLGYSLLTPNGQVGNVNTIYNSLGVNASFALDGSARGGAAGTILFREETSRKSFRLHSFDLLLNKTDLNSATHIKNNFLLSDDMVYLGGTNYASPAPIIANSVAIGVDYTSSTTTYNDVTSADNRYPHYSFRLKNCFYFNNNTPSVNTVQINNTIYNTDRNILNYYGEEFILAETLKAFPTSYNIPGFSTPSIADDTAVNMGVQINTKTSNLYLSSICAYKPNVYTDFSVQEIVDTGFIYKVEDGIGDITIDTTVSPELGNGKIFGGDCFINGYSHRNTCNCNLDFVGVYTAPEFNVSSVYWYPVISASNINFRTPSTELTSNLFYPKNTFGQVSLLQDFTKTNYINYNNDYSSINDLRDLPTNSINKTNDNTMFKTRVIRSAVQDKNSIKDNYRIFLVNDYIDLDKNRGQVECLKTDGNRVIIHMTRALPRTLPKVTLKTDDVLAYLGQGDIFSINPYEISYTDTGYAGTQSQFAGCLTQYGYIFPDLQSGRVFKVSDTLEEISAYGMFNFFQDNLPIKLYDDIRNSFKYNIPVWNNDNISAGIYELRIFDSSIYINNDAVTSLDVPNQSASWDKLLDISSNFLNMDNLSAKDSVGCIGGWDDKFKRYILHKRDFNFNYVDFNIKPYSDFISYSIGDLIIRNGIIYYVDGERDPSILYLDDFTVNFGEFVATRADLSKLSQFTNRVFTISYYPEKKSWGSFHTYYPDKLFYTINDLYSFKGLSNDKYWIYKHNNTNKILDFYSDDEITDKHSFKIEYVYNSDLGIDKKIDSLTYITKSININKAVDLTKTFNRCYIFNNYQCTGYIDLTDSDNARLVEDLWHVNNFRDLVLNYDFPFILNNTLNESNIDYYKEFYERKRITGLWCAARFEYNPDEEDQSKLISEYSLDKLRVLFR